MASSRSYIAEFEDTGTTEVRRRVLANVYDGEHLAHALLWLDQQSTAASLGPKPPADPEAERQAARRQLDTLIRAAVVATIAVSVIGLGSMAYQSLVHRNAGGLMLLDHPTAIRPK